MVAKTTLEEFLKRAKEVHEDKYDYSFIEEFGPKKKVKIYCKTHNLFFYQLSTKHLSGQGCYLCRNEKISKKKSSNTDDFIAKARLIHGDRYDYSLVNYVSNRTPIIVICKKHGEFLVLPTNHLKGCQCESCSRYVSNISNEWLDFIGIPNDSEHREVKRLIPGRKFVVDGYDPETKTIYEFYGDKAHGNLRVFDPDVKNPIKGTTYGESYKMTLERERIFKEHGYNIVSIWEYDYRRLILDPSDYSYDF